MESYLTIEEYNNLTFEEQLDYLKFTDDELEIMDELDSDIVDFFEY